MGGATYAGVPEFRGFRRRCFPASRGTEHQADEYIEIDSLLKTADIANAIFSAVQIEGRRQRSLWMKCLTSDELRQMYLDFFQEQGTRGHKGARQLIRKMIR